MLRPLGSVAAFLFWRAILVHAAPQPNETLAFTYDVEFHDCPQPCEDYSNTHSWIPYQSVHRLRRCHEPLLIQFSVTQALDDPNSNILIRSCSLSTGVSVLSENVAVVDNPKKADNLLLPSLETAPACSSEGTAHKVEVQLATGGGVTENVERTTMMLEGLRTFFEAKDNCDENFMFAYNNGTVVGLYIGAALGKSTVDNVLSALSQRLHGEGTANNQTVAQLCSSERSHERAFGVIIDSTGNLAAVQRTVLGWSKGICVTDRALQPVPALSRINIMMIAKSNDTFNGNNTSNHNGTSLLPRSVKKINSRGQTLKRIPAKRAPNADGSCAVHLIVNGDTCSSLAITYGITEADIEKWNKGKTWAWTVCKNMMQGYNMCVSDGSPPLPPPQAGTACGPLVPGTLAPTDGTSLARLNPCPLNACCSNWGFCGVFPAHCDIHAPDGGGPGTKLDGFQNTCISNCGNEIKRNSGPPGTFSRIGYYESFNFKRNCLWMNASNANTDGTYTHIHWSFGEIDPQTWKLKITDPGNQWQDFKKLKVKRIVSIGGWAASTEAATYNIIRQAIIDNTDTFARNLAQFVKDEGIDGIDIDWEYPGAPDIMVGGQPIGKSTDGAYYLRFLTTVKSYLGSDKSVSIAAPASFWYLKAFPIARIASVIDYIVYMTYDLHGQWDYGNPNSFDQCASGRCIRSHVNLTETKNALSMITKAGVPNNKIFVGEASYGRSFHMAQDGCAGPLCEFTGSRGHSDATPGRCTQEGGYLAYAEIVEILRRGDSVQTYHDDDSSSNIMLYKGDYISYMTPEKKDQRREDWKGLNFAGSIDWAVDLQEFGEEDYNAPFITPDGEACISGEDVTLNTGKLCEFSCSYGFCPETLCECMYRGGLKTLEERSGSFEALDAVDMDFDRLCNFACKRNFCPTDICVEKKKDDVEESDGSLGYEVPAREAAEKMCILYKDSSMWQQSITDCLKPCKEAVDAAKAEGRTTNYGCIGFYPGQKSIPWKREPHSKYYMAPGQCSCDNWILNEVADTVLEAMPMIAQIGCYILMSSLKFVLDVGLQFVPVVGKALDAGLDMATTAAQMAAYLYPKEQDPEGAFSWWLSPCGGTDLVPDDIKKIFNILSTVADGVSSFVKPRNLGRGSGRRGDSGNPNDRSKPRSTNNNNNNNNNKKKCEIKPAMKERRIGSGANTIRKMECVKDTTRYNDQVITSAVYAANPVTTTISSACPVIASQACYHYSSAIKRNPQWATLTCPPEAASTRYRVKGNKATASWKAQHTGLGWTGEANNPNWAAVKADPRYNGCEMDEYPPAYLLSPRDPAIVNGGIDTTGQNVRLLPGIQNGAGAVWGGICFRPIIADMSDADMIREIASDRNPRTIKTKKNKILVTETHVSITITKRAVFTMTSWPQPPPPPANFPNVGDTGLADNPCWDQQRAAADPGFALLNFDAWYKVDKNPQPYKYDQKYVQGSNGS